MSASLMKRYKAHLEKLREAKVPLGVYECPECGQLIHTQVPPHLGNPPGTHIQIWDSGVLCPMCEGQHFRAITSAGQITINGKVQS